MRSTAVLLQEPESLVLAELALRDPGVDDIVVETEWSGISSGTERLLWTGEMPPFPGLGYPLVPGYESVGRVVEAGGPTLHLRGGASSSLAATAFQKCAACSAQQLGISSVQAAGSSRSMIPSRNREPCLRSRPRPTMRLQVRSAASDPYRRTRCTWSADRSRLHRARRCAPGRWEREAFLCRAASVTRWPILPKDWRSSSMSFAMPAAMETCSTPDRTPEPGRRDRPRRLLSRALVFRFPPAFMREAKLRIAAEWKPADLAAVSRLVAEGASRSTASSPTCAPLRRLHKPIVRPSKIAPVSKCFCAGVIPHDCERQPTMNDFLADDGVLTRAPEKPTKTTQIMRSTARAASARVSRSPISLT